VYIIFDHAYGADYKLFHKPIEHLGLFSTPHSSNLGLFGSQKHYYRLVSAAIAIIITSKAWMKNLLR
jgi:hypothetical protein